MKNTRLILALRVLVFFTCVLVFALWNSAIVGAQTLTKTPTSTSTSTLQPALSTSTSTSTSTDTSWYSLQAVAPETSSTNVTADSVASEYDSRIFYRGGAFNLGLSSPNQALRLTGVNLYQSAETACQSEAFSVINDHPAVESHSAVKGFVKVYDSTPNNEVAPVDGYKWRVYSQGLIYKKNTLWSKSVSLYTNSNAASRIQNVPLDFVTSSKPRSGLVYLAILKGFKIYDTHFDANLLNGFGVKTLWFNLSAPVLSADGQSVDVTVIPSVSSFEGAVNRLQAEIYYDVIAYDPEHWGHKGISWYSADGAIQSTTDTGENKYFYRYHNLDLGMSLNSLDQVFVSFYKYGFNTSSALPFEFDKFWATAAPTALNGNQLQVKLSGMLYGHQGALPTDPEKYLYPTELKGYAIYCKNPETCHVSFAGSGTGTTNWDNSTYGEVMLPDETGCADYGLEYNITNEAVALSSSTDSSMQLASSTDTNITTTNTSTSPATDSSVTLSATSTTTNSSSTSGDTSVTLTASTTDATRTTDTSSGDADSTSTTTVTLKPASTTTNTNTSTTTTDTTTVTARPADTTTDDTTISITDGDATAPTRDVTLVAVDTTDTNKTTNTTYTDVTLTTTDTTVSKTDGDATAPTRDVTLVAVDTTDTNKTTNTSYTDVTLTTTDTTISKTDGDATTPTRDVTLVAVDTTDTSKTTDGNTSVDTTLTVQESDANLFPESQVVGYTGTTVTTLSNLKMEIWDSTGNKPKFFNFWRRYYKDFGDSFVDYNTFATLLHDNQVKRGETGYSLKIKVDDVTYGQGIVSVNQAITDKTLILPNRVYEFSTYMKTQDFGGEPQVSIQVRYKKKDGSNGYREFAVKGMRGTHDWTKFSVVGTTPPESEVLEFTSVTFTVGAYVYPEDEKGLMWTDDWEIREYQNYGDIEMSTTDTVYVSPDAVTQAPVSVLSKGNVWTLNAAGNVTGPIQMILDLPDGITLVGTQAKKTNLPAPTAITIMGRPYQRYVLEYPQIHLNHYSAENLLLQSRWSNGQKGSLYLATKWSGGERTARAYPVEAVAIPVALRPEHLKTSVLSWAFPNVKETWPNLLTLLKRIGAQGFTFDMIDFRRADVQPHVQTFMEPARSLGLDVTARYSPFYKTMTAFTDAELARRADGTIASFMCPALRTGNYLQELGVFNEAAKRGISWFDFDFEGEAHGLFCSGAFEDFKSRYPEFASAAPAGVTPPRDFNFNDLIDDAANVATLSNEEKIYDSKDATWLEFQTDKGTELWKSVYDSILDGLAESGSQELPTMFNWRTNPGMVYSSYNDFDKMRAEFPISANVAVYLGYGGHTLPHMGEYIRRTLLGVYSADAENLQLNPGFETAADASGAFPPKGYTSQDPAGITYVDLNAGAGRTLHGTRSIKMTTPGKKLSRVINNLKAGESYVFGASSFRSRRGMEGCIELTWLDSQGQALPDNVKDCGPTFEGQWQRLAVYETMPETATLARLDFYAEGSAERGAVWFDDAHVVRPNLVNNASFEEGDTSPSGFNSTADATRNLSFVTGFAHHGQRSARIKNGDSYSPGLVTTVSVKEHFPYEFSASIAAPQNSSVQLAIEWLDENSQSLGTQQTEQFSVSTSQGWQKLVFTANSPNGAALAKISVQAQGNESDLFYVDDLHFRVDGAYVIPYVTAGYRGSDFDHEVTAETFQDLLLESFVAGAEGHASYPGNGWSGKDMAVFANTNNMLAPVEDIIANGTAIPQSRLQSANASFQTRGMESGDDALILVSYYGRAAGSTTISFDKMAGGSLKEIHHDGSATTVSSLAAGKASFGVSLDASTSGHHTKLFVFEHSKTTLSFPEETDSTATPADDKTGDTTIGNTTDGDKTTGDTTTGDTDKTGDVSVAPSDPGLIDRIIDFFDGDDSSSGDKTSGGDTTTGDTTGDTGDGQIDLSKGDQTNTSTEHGKFFVANENDDDGTRPVGIGEFRADGGYLRSHAQTVDATQTPMLSMAGLAQISSTIYATGRDLYSMDLNVGTFNRLTVPGYDEHGENVNALCRYNGQLVIVSAAGGWIHVYDPVHNELHHGVAGGFDSPQGCKQVGGDLFVIDREKIYRLEKCGEEFVSEVFFELDSVDPAHFSEGGLEAKGGYLFYTNHAPDWNTGHLVAVNMTTREGKIVVPIERNPRGLVIDPQGQYIYVSQLTNAAVVKVRLDKTMSYLTGAVSTPPLVESFITDETNLAGPFGLHWVEDPSSTLTVTTPRGDLCGQTDDSGKTGGCPEGTHAEEGACVPDASTDNPESSVTVDCKEGLHLVNGVCVPDDSIDSENKCGNGVVDPYEACDDALPAPEGYTCRDCHLKPIEQTTEPAPEPAPVDEDKTDTTATCPNGILETGEECEVAHEEDGDRIFIGFDPHTEICTSDCKKHDIVSNEPGDRVKPVCGNGILEGLEQCELPNLGFNPEIENCNLCLVSRKATDPKTDPSPEPTPQTDDCGPKDLVCPGNKIFKTDGCHSWCEDFTVTVTPTPTDKKEPTPTPEQQHDGLCGNGKKEGTEQCDGRDGIRFSTEVCTQDCQIVQLVPDPQDNTPVCGNGVLESGEQCDGGDGKTLAGVGFDSKTQECANCQIKALPAEEQIITPDEPINLIDKDTRDPLEENLKDDEEREFTDEENEISEDEDFQENINLCGNGELDADEECDPAQTFAEGEGMTVRICNYRCQFITLVLTCDHDHDHAEHEHDTTTADDTTVATVVTNDQGTSGTTPMSGPSTGVNTVPGQQPATSQSNAQSGATAEPQSQPWGGYGLSGGGCQLSKTTTEASGLAPVLFGLSLLFAVILRRRARG